MRVFVAGASGAIGEPLTAELLKKGHSVVGMTTSEARARIPIAFARAGMRVAMLGCNQDAETRGRANRRCTAAKRATRICERCWCRRRSTSWDRLVSTVTCDDEG